MNVYAVVVTYGNRFHLVQKVINALIGMGIHRIVVVDNNSAAESRAGLDAYAKRRGKITVMPMNVNSGSAAGYALGIEYSRAQKDCGFIWLLDDDNLPDADALAELRRAWADIDVPDKNRALCLASHRTDRPAYLQAVIKGEPDLVLGRKNMFRSFHAASAIGMLAGRIFGTQPAKPGAVPRFGLVSVATYGGMFFHRDLVQVIGLPDESYYLYVDDHEYSHRVVKKGGCLYLVTTSRITDIDRSWHVGSDSLAFKKIALDENYFRLFYSVRNRVYFEKCEMVTNRAVYFLNAAIYSFFVCAAALTHLRMKNMRIYLTAIRCGWRKDMGVNPDYTLS